MIESYTDFKAEFRQQEKTYRDFLEEKNPQDHEKYKVLLKKHLKQLENLVKEYELQISSEGGVIPSDFGKDFKDKKALIREFKSMYSDKEDKLNSLRLNSLVGEVDEDEEDGNSGFMKEQAQFQRARSKMGEATTIATNINAKMFENKEKLMHSLQTTKAIDGDQSLSVSLLGSLQKLQNKQRTTFYLAVFFVVGGMLLVFYNKFFSKTKQWTGRRGNL